MANTKTFKTSIDIDSKVRAEMSELLNRQLADTFDLYSQTKQAHWNVKGVEFFQLHELYDTLAGKLLAPIDEIAERITSLGGTALGTVQMAADTSRLPDFPTVVNGRESLAALVERYATVAASTRKAIDTATEAGDATTADLFTEISRELDKDLWFLEAHLQSSAE
jgi:starvation-inducible DNA-binding protein